MGLILDCARLKNTPCAHLSTEQILGRSNSFQDVYIGKCDPVPRSDGGYYNPAVNHKLHRRPTDLPLIKPINTEWLTSAPLHHGRATELPVTSEPDWIHLPRQNSESNHLFHTNSNHKNYSAIHYNQLNHFDKIQYNINEINQHEESYNQVHNDRIHYSNIGNFGVESPCSLDESGIESSAPSIMSSSTMESHRSATLRAPTTPHAIRQKPPPKPPRLSSFNSSLHNGMNDSSMSCPPASPGGNSSNKSSFGDITLDSSFCSHSATDLQPISRIYPCSTQDKVYHIVLQTKDFLVNELDVQSLLSPLLARGILEPRAIKQLKNTNSKTAMAELLLDMLMGKKYKEFINFCDVLRNNDRYVHLADLLLALDCLVDLGSEDSVKKRQSGSYSPDTSAAEISNHVNSDPDGCPVCIQNQGPEIDDLLMDTTNFDVEIVYINKETGHIKPQKEVAVLKMDKLMSCDRTASVPKELNKHEADRYIPIITVSLYNYCLWDIGMDKVATALHRKTCIRELSLSKCHIGLHSVQTLSLALQQNQGVFKLDLRLNNLSKDCLSELSAGLKKNSSIKAINLSSTDLTSDGVGVLLESICRNQSTSELDIGFNDLMDKGSEVIAQSLLTNCPLKKLRIRDNSITFDGAFRLFKALKKNSRLVFLDISSNSIGNKAMVTLSEILRYNRTLKQINLENCGISAEGCQMLARALKTNTVLKMLNLSMNPVGDDGLDGLAEGLKYNQVLDVLCLNMCDITNRGFSHLLESLQFNMSLKTLKLCYNKIGRVCHECQQLDMNKNKVGCHGDKPSINGNDTECVPSIEDIYDKLCQILQQNQDLKVLLWGNKLDDGDDIMEHLCDHHASSKHGSDAHTVHTNVSDKRHVNGDSAPINIPCHHVNAHGCDNTHMNKMQRDFVQQYTIHNSSSPRYNSGDTVSDGRYSCDTIHQSNDPSHAASELVYSSPVLFNGNHCQSGKIHNHYASDTVFNRQLSLSIPASTAISCGSVYRPQISPRMGTTASSVSYNMGSHSTLQSESADLHHPRIRTNGSLPWRHKHTTKAISPTSNGGVIATPDNDLAEEEKDVFMPHTFPRRGLKKTTPV